MEQSQREDLIQTLLSSLYICSKGDRVDILIRCLLVLISDESVDNNQYLNALQNLKRYFGYCIDEVIEAIKQELSN